LFFFLTAISGSIVHSRQIGKYQIIARVGNVGHSQIFKALHPDLDRVVAIEAFNRAASPDRDAWDRFRQEKRKMAALRHPNILHIYDLEVVGDAVLVVMEYVEGETLAQRLMRLQREGRRMSLRRALRIVIAVGRAIHYAREQGVDDCAVEPTHVMLRDDNQVVLTNLGLTGGLADTSAYRAPEQQAGARPDERSEVYGLGVMLYQLTTGQLPPEIQVPRSRKTPPDSHAPLSPRRLRDDIPPALEQVMLRALAQAPPNRYQSVQELVSAARDALYQMEVKPALKPTAAQPQKPRALRRLGWFGVGVSVGLLLSAAVFLARPSVSSPPNTPNATLRAEPQDQAGAALVARLMALEVALSVTPLPSSTPSITPDWPTPTPTPTSPASPSPSPSPVPSPTAAVCRLSLTVVQNTNYDGPDWGQAVGAPFEKTWLLRNDGNCAWPQGTVLAPLDGQIFDLTTPFPVNALPPNWDGELTVPLRAPSAAGYYEGRFQLQTPAGQPIGEPLTVKLQVRPLATAAPSATPVLTPTLTPPVHILGWELTGWQDDAAHNTWTGKLHLWAEGGDGQYVWYRDTIDNPLPGDVLEFQWRRCANFFGSVWVSSGGSVDHVSLYIAYPGSCE
jgi:serine/threonine protein kinase